MKRKHSDDNGDGVSKKKSRREKVIVLHHIVRGYLYLFNFLMSLKMIRIKF